MYPLILLCTILGCSSAADQIVRNIRRTSLLVRHGSTGCDIRSTVYKCRGGYTYGNEYGYYHDEDDETDDATGEYQYGDDDFPPRRERENNNAASMFDMVANVGAGNRKLGFILAGSGSLVTFLGVVFFFNSGLLKLGNMLFVSGLPLIIGPSRTIQYFLNPSRLRATITFGFGLFLVLFAGWPLTGLIVEVFGIMNLFGNFFPLLRGLLSNLPGAGALFGGANRQPPEDSYHYYDDRY